MERRELHKKILLEYFFAVLWILGMIFVFPKLLRFFMPFVIGWVIAMIANPLVRILEKRVKIARKHSSVIITILVLGIVVFVIYGLVVILFRQTVSLMEDLPVIIGEIQLQLNSLAQNMQGLYDILPADTKDILTDTGSSLVGAVTGFLSDVSTSFLDGAGYKRR